jgi:hypothetical protein
MGVLGRAAAAAAVLAGAAVTGCYSPAVRDCTVTCDAPGDCAAGQVCGADGMCAAPGVAGRCAMVAPDAGDGPRDAGADAAADAPATVRLTVQVMGKGKVDVPGVGACSSLDPQKGNCAFDVAPGAALTAHAMQIQIDQVFDMWTSQTCAGQPARCTFAPDTATTITARFERWFHGD